MNPYERPSIRGYAAALVASTLGALRSLPPACTWFWLVTPTAIEAAIFVTLVLFHVLPGLLGTPGAEVTRHG